MASRSPASNRGRQAQRRPGLQGGVRRLAALHGLVFLFAVVVVPHRHVNSLEDLLSDGPSDSGVVLIGGTAQAIDGSLELCGARFIDDDPCLACFHNDFAAGPVSSLVFAPTFSPLAQLDIPSLLAAPAPTAIRRQTRAPPPIA